MAANFDMRELAQLADAWQRAPAIVTEELEAAMYLSAGMLHSEIVDNTPTGASGGSGAGLSGSITYNVSASIGRVTGVVGTANPYAEAVELGTKPHFPPVEPIYEWVQAKLGISGLEGVGIAAKIALKISHHGTKGRFMFRDSLERLTPDIERTLRDGLSRIMNRLENAV